MKIALITDTHYGARSDNVLFHDYFEKFYLNFFFPYLEEHKIEQIIHLGDVFDRRKYVNYYSLSRCKKYFFDQIKNRMLSCTMLVGNHDIPYKNTLELNSLNLLLQEYEDIFVVSKPMTQTYAGFPIALVPWICDDNYDDTMNMIKTTNATTCFGHLELDGFEMNKGIVHLHGMSPTIFSKFELVASGHFHHRSRSGNINYLGCPYEMDWADFDDPKGFHIFDTETRELTFIENPYRLFHKLFYDDVNRKMNDLLADEFDQYTDTYVKVVVQNKKNPYWFDLWIEKLHKSSPHHVQIVEDNQNLQLKSEEELIDEAEDTVTILHKYIDNLEIDADKNKLEIFLRSLYDEAMSIV